MNVIVYARASILNGLSEQLSALAIYCRDHAYTIESIYVDVLPASKSWKSRPGLLQAVQDAIHNSLTLLVMSKDRIFRHADIAILQARGVTIHEAKA